MPDMISTLAETVWVWLLAGNNASAAAVLLTVVGGALSVAVKIRRPKAPPPSATPGGNQATATEGSVAIGGNAHNSKITANVTHNHAPTRLLTLVGVTLILFGTLAITLPHLNNSGVIMALFGSGNTITTTINSGLTKEQIDAIFVGVRDLSQNSEGKAIATAAQFGTISHEALTSFFTILRQQQVPPEQLTAKLTSIALQYTEMVERLAALEKTAEPDDRPALAEARTAILKGNYDRAERLLVTLEDAQATARAKAQTNADSLARRQAATRAERANLSALRFNYHTAAEHYLAAAALLPVGDTEDRGNYITSSADALQQHGDERGDNSALSTAIARYRDALPSHDRHPALWARVQNNLGNTLSILARREGNGALLRQAADAYSNALLEYTRDRAPLDWALTQNNLGATLSTLGEREDDSVLLRQAVDAYKNALLECTRDHVPLNWAMMQTNLGIALSLLGQREGDSTLLRQAVDAYKNALLEHTRDRVPLSWAATQINLGTALLDLGKREGDSALLRQAVDAYKNALLEYTRDRIPLNWAITQNNLGTALQTLGQRERDGALMKQAVDAYTNALLEKARDRVPLSWAITQNNLSTSLLELAKLTRDPASARQAVTAYEAALEMFIHLNTPYYIEGTTQNLARARATLAKLDGGADSPPHQ